MDEVALPGWQGGHRVALRRFVAVATWLRWCPRREDVGAGSAAGLDGPGRLELGVGGDDGDAADPQITGELARRRKARPGGECAVRDLPLQTFGDLLVERPGASWVQGQHRAPAFTCMWTVGREVDHEVGCMVTVCGPSGPVYRSSSRAKR